MDKFENDGNEETEEVANKTTPEDAQLKAMCNVKEVRTTAVAGFATEELFQTLNDVSSMAANWFGDLNTAKTPIFICGLVFSVLLGFAWVYFMRSAAWYVCWATIILAQVFLLGFDLCLYAKAGLLGSSGHLKFLQEQAARNSYTDQDLIPDTLPASLQEDSGPRKGWYRVSAIVLSVVWLIIVALTATLRKKINVTIGIVKEAGKSHHEDAAHVLSFLYVSDDALPHAVLGPCVCVHCIIWQHHGRHSQRSEGQRS